MYAGLIIGADGQQSTCRENAFPQISPLRSTGKTVNRTIINIETIRRSQLKDFMLSPSQHFWLGHGSELVCYLLKSVLNPLLICPAGDEAFIFRTSAYGYGRDKVSIPWL